MAVLGGAAVSYERGTPVHEDDSKGPQDLLACPTWCLSKTLDLERWRHESESGPLNHRNLSSQPLPSEEGTTIKG